MEVLILNSFNFIRMITYEKPGGRGPRRCFSPFGKDAGASLDFAPTRA
jgi:hypothetical protein